MPDFIHLGGFERQEILSRLGQGVELRGEFRVQMYLILTGQRGLRFEARPYNANLSGPAAVLLIEPCEATCAPEVLEDEDA